MHKQNLQPREANRLTTLRNTDSTLGLQNHHSPYRYMLENRVKSLYTGIGEGICDSGNFYTTKQPLTITPNGNKNLNSPSNQTTRIPNLKTKRNDYWYKGKKYPLNEEQYILAESIFQFMFQYGETPWN